MGVTLPYTITNGTPHDAVPVQGNFEALRDGHNTHAHDGVDTPKVNFANIDGKPATYPPSAHKTSHASGGTDAITPADIGAVPTSDVVTTPTANKILRLNASAKLPTSITGDASNADKLGGKTLIQVIQIAAPPGAIMAFARSTPPDGWLECNGAAVSRTAYADLFAAIGTTFGAGDGTTTFNLPDLRGEFIRGWDHGRGVDANRAFGSAQADELKAHTHTYSAPGVGYNVNAGSQATVIAGTSVISTGSTGGAETRPRNVALMYCIKY